MPIWPLQPPTGDWPSAPASEVSLLPTHLAGHVSDHEARRVRWKVLSLTQGGSRAGTGWDRVGQGGGHSKQEYAAGDTTAGTLVGTNHKAVEVNEENPILHGKKSPANPINPKRIICSFAQGRGSSRGRMRPQSRAAQGEEKKDSPLRDPDQRECPCDLLVGAEATCTQGLAWDQQAASELLSFPKNQDPQRKSDF